MRADVLTYVPTYILPCRLTYLRADLLTYVRAPYVRTPCLLTCELPTDLPADVLTVLTCERLAYLLTYVTYVTGLPRFFLTFFLTSLLTSLLTALPVEVLAGEHATCQGMARHD